MVKLPSSIQLLEEVPCRNLALEWLWMS